MMVTEQTVRVATPTDLPRCVDLLGALHGESVWADQPADFDYVLLWLLWTLRTRTDYQLLVCEREGNIVGLCGAAILNHPLLPHAHYLQEWAFYVEPEARNHGMAKELWDAMKVWGRHQGAIKAVRGKEQGDREILFWESLE